MLYTTGAKKWHIVSLLSDVTSPTTVAHYVSMTCSEHGEALTVAPTADGVHKQAIRVQGEASLCHSSGWGTEAFPLSSVICAAVLYTNKIVIINKVAKGHGSIEYLISHH